MKEEIILFQAATDQVPPFSLRSEIHYLMLNSSFEVYHTCQFTFISAILIWLELLQTVILVSDTVLGKT